MDGPSHKKMMNICKWLSLKISCFQASFLGCDILMDPDRIPPMVKDFYWDKQNCPIPYTEASMHFKKKTYKGSADDMV